ncbi:MAG: phenylalanine--tRNA ligase subunit alpha, partial [Actinomycetota bacterium]|nr:phenylalanine--tRNA ligase subunit alpha [Actinomycetota bacterium]
MSDYQKLVDEARAIAAAAQNTDELSIARTKFLGKKSVLSEAKKKLGILPGSERAAAGKELNEIRALLEETFTDRETAIEAKVWDLRFETERMDLSERHESLRRGHLHLITQARDHLEDVFVGMGFTVAEGPEVETAWYNFEALNIPDWHPARGNFDTIFVDLGDPEEVMLRSHTSPVQVRTMEKHDPPIYIVAPGRTFRTDNADATHLPAFNQIEGLVVDKGITMGDLAGTIDSFVQAFFGSEVKSRL